MQINQLKNLIMTKTLSDDFLIFICKEDTFLSSQYINEIAKLNYLKINKITNLNEIANSSLSLVFDYQQNLNILKVDEFNEYYDDYSVFKNTIVICNKVSKNIEDKVKDFTVTFPALEDWQIIDYMKVYCKSLDKDEIEWLFNASNKNIYKVLNELDKINLFTLQDQKMILSELRFDKYSDLYHKDIYAVVDAIINKDKIVLLDFLKHKDIANYDTFAIVSLLISKLKNILYVNFNSGLDVTQIGISQKQAMWLSRNYKDYSEKTLKKSLEYLTGIDKQLKLGKLETKNLTESIICHMLNF